MPDCSGCHAHFTLEEFVEHADIEPIGMQFVDAEMKWNMFYFNHTCPACGSTILLPVTDFLPFIDETIPETVLAGTDTCERHCMSIADLRGCSQECHYAPFRRFLLKMLSDRRSRAEKVAT
ncbi:MAG: hypothetical protein Kow0074_09430 [Candidatus Zixiibacteriota bacterium]